MTTSWLSHSATCNFLTVVVIIQRFYNPFIKRYTEWRMSFFGIYVKFTVKKKAKK